LANADRPVNAAAIEAILQASARLPRGPRQEVEAAFIEAVGRNLRTWSDAFDRKRIERARAVLRVAEPVFGWLHDDALVHALLGARDAAAFCLIAREESRHAAPRPG